MTMKKLNLAFLRSPRFRYGSLSTALLCVAIALLFALNDLFTALEKQHGWRVDFSFNSITSHSKTDSFGRNTRGLWRSI